MGRNKKTGLDYFPFDIDFFSNLRIRKLIKYQGGKAVTVYALLLCSVYKQGYYIRWDEELPFIVSEQTGFEEAYIREVIKSCLAVGLFSKEQFESEKIITSKGIQERFQTICVLSRRVCDIKEFSLISSDRNLVFAEETDINSEEKPVNSAKSAQRKEKEIEENCKHGDSPDPSDGSAEKINYQGVVDYFNRIFEGKLSHVDVLNDSRRKAIRARMAEFGREAVAKVFRIVLQSPFLMGNNDRNWKASFDWIFKASNFVKIMEGTYLKLRNETETTTNYDHGDFLK